MSKSTPNGLTPIEAVTFSGGSLQVIGDSQGAAWMLLRPACEALGLDVEGQRMRLERAPWSFACVMQAEGSHGKRRSYYCLRGDRVAMWLATISVRRVRPELRERLSQWQCEAADALARWAAGRAQPQPAPPAGTQLSFPVELRQLVAQEVRNALQQERTGELPPAQPSNQALKYGILLRRPVVSGWPQLAHGVTQCCRFLKTDCLTSAKMSELLAYDAEAVPALVSAVEKLTGRRTLSGRQLGYLLSCAQKRGLVENDGRLHSHGGYGWSALNRPADAEHPPLTAGLTRNVFPLFPSPPQAENAPDLRQVELGRQALQCLGQAVEQGCRRLDAGQVTAADLARLLKSDPESLPGLTEVARYLGLDLVLNSASIGYLLRSAQKKPEFSAKRVGKGRLGTQWSPRAWLLPAHEPEAARGIPSASS